MISQSIRMPSATPANTPAIAQIKGAGIKTVSPNTQGVPKLVSNVRAKIAKKGTVRNVTVTFTQNANDPYFTHAEIYLRLGSTNPNLVAKGNSSPLTFSTTATTTPATVIISSVGNWGSTPINSSPVAAIDLA